MMKQTLPVPERSVHIAWPDELLALIFIALYADGVRTTEEYVALRDLESSVASRISRLVDQHVLPAITYLSPVITARLSPPSLARFCGLRELTLPSGLTEPSPELLRSFTALNRLVLRKMAWKPVNRSHALSTLTTLRTLVLERLAGFFFRFDEIPWLEELELRRVTLSLVNSEFDHLTQLRVLRLAQKRDAIPVSLAPLTSLRELDLSEDSHYRDHQISKLTALEVLHLPRTSWLHVTDAAVSQFARLTRLVAGYDVHDACLGRLTALRHLELDARRSRVTWRGVVQVSSHLDTCVLHGGLPLSAFALLRGLTSLTLSNADEMQDQELAQFTNLTSLVLIAQRNVTPWPLRALTRLETLKLEAMREPWRLFYTVPRLTCLVRLELRRTDWFTECDLAPLSALRYLVVDSGAKLSHRQLTACDARNVRIFQEELVDDVPVLLRFSPRV